MVSKGSEGIEYKFFKGFKLRDQGSEFPKNLHPLWTHLAIHGNYPRETAVQITKDLRALGLPRGFAFGSTLRLSNLDPQL